MSAGQGHALSLAAIISLLLLTILSLTAPVTPLTRVKGNSTIAQSVSRYEDAAVRSGIVIKHDVASLAVNVSLVKSSLGSVDVVVRGPHSMKLPAGSANRSQLAPQRGSRADTPMLNHIFDMHSSLHEHSHHKDRFNAPRIVSEGRSVSVHSHDKAQLDCRVTSLQDKVVSWVRRKPEDGLLDILTIGQQTFTADTRFSALFLPPDVWRLIIASTVPGDSGAYECQLSTHPPLSSRYVLTVHRPRIEIIEGDKDRYYERNSTLSLGCTVRHFPGAQVTWLHQAATLNDDMTRGGVSVRSESSEGGAESVLQVARLAQSDSGMYTCLVKDADLSASVSVHVLNESLAELHQGSSGAAWRLCGLPQWLVCLPCWLTPPWKCLTCHALLTLTLR